MHNSEFDLFLYNIWLSTAIFWKQVFVMWEDYWQKIKSFYSYDKVTIKKVKTRELYFLSV